MCEKKEITILVPDGYEIDEVKSTFQKIIFKKKENDGLPMTWEDLKIVEGYSINGNAGIYAAINCPATNNHKNIFPSLEETNAMLAMSQLCQLRDAWNKGWKPDWNNDEETKFVIYNSCNEVHINFNINLATPMSFKTAELRDKFLVTFAELLETAKPFL